VPVKAANVAAEERRLHASLYERVSSGLLAAAIAVGAVVSLLLLAWLGNQLLEPARKAVPVEWAQVNPDGEGGGDRRAPGGSQLDIPSDELRVGRDKKTADAAETDIATGVGKAVAEKAAEIVNPDLVEPTRLGSQGSGGGVGGGIGPGGGWDIGDRKPGLPRHWEIVFPKGNTLDAYARQLDFFGIELGVLRPDNSIVYAFHLAKPKPDTKVVTDPQKNERRYYLSWRDGDLRKADRELLARAGIHVEDELVLQFLPRQTEEKLYLLEGSYRGVERKKIDKTRFGIQPTGDGFAFYVLEQTVRR
jgi:hypothetical protein